MPSAAPVTTNVLNVKTDIEMERRCGNWVAQRSSLWMAHALCRQQRAGGEKAGVWLKAKGKGAAPISLPSYPAPPPPPTRALRLSTASWRLA
jgi:hypothetical protein